MEQRIVTKQGEFYLVHKPLKEELKGIGLKELNHGFDLDGKKYSLEGLADFLTWNKGKDGKFRIICYNLNIFENLREYWAGRNKKEKKNICRRALK